jgi:hypothetical protein
MSRRKGYTQKPTLHKVEPSRVSPDDIKFRMMEVERQRALDTRTDLEKIFGDPPKHRSALAMKTKS